MNDRLYNERFSGQGANTAQMLTLVFWVAFVTGEVVGVTEQREWVLAGWLLPALLLQVLMYGWRVRFPLWNREEEYVFPPEVLPQPVEEESARAFASRVMPPLCCAEEDMSMEHTCLHAGDVPWLPCGSLYVSVSFRRAEGAWRHGLTEAFLCIVLPFLWVLSLLCLMLGIPLADALCCFGLVGTLCLLCGFLWLWAERFSPRTWQGECLELLWVGTAFLGGLGVLGYVLFHHLW